MSGLIHSGVEDVVLSNDRTDEDPKRTLKEPALMVPGDFVKGSGAGAYVGGLGTSTNSDGSLSCDICNIKVTSAKILQRHLEGRKHKSRFERRGKTFHCDLCDVTANSEIQLNIHLSSSKHKSRVAREEYKEFTDMSSYSTSMYILFFCIFCILLNLVILVKVAY